MDSASDDLARPRLYHVTILALKMTDFVAPYPTPSLSPYAKRKSNQISDVLPSLALILKEKAIIGEDEIVILEGCETILHFR
ncbi:hypothetical protein V8E51_003643 [Hyaloscypha variabilis]